MERVVREAGERGGAAVELTLLAPVLIAFLLLMVALGRLGQARADVDGAARDAARAASIARTTAGAESSAREATASALGDRGVTCRSLGVDVDAGDFAPGGSVAVEVSCDVSFADLSLLRVPGTKTVHARSVAVVDFYRGTG